MIAQVLTHTPSWVYALFIALLGFGLVQTRTRTVRRTPALLLPAGMLALSLAGIVSSFGLAPLPLAAWGLTLATATLLGATCFRDTRICATATNDAFHIPGSWMPLVVMLAIFAAKYGYGVMRAFQADIITTPGFIAALSAVYGLLSGYFAARAVTLLRPTQSV